MTKQCQAWFGADDVCGLPEESPVHQRTDGRGHLFYERHFADGSPVPSDDELETMFWREENGF